MENTKYKIRKADYNKENKIKIMSEQNNSHKLNTYENFNHSLNLALLGDGKAKFDLLTMLSPLIKASIKKYCPIYKDYEDLYQDCNLIILESLETFDGKRSFLKYIKSYIKYYLLDTLKYIKAEKEVPRRDEEGNDLLENIKSEEDIEEDYIKKKGHEKLNLALKSLPPRQKMIVYNFYYKKMSLKAIAKEMGISKWTVVAAKNQALKNLRRNFNDNWKEINKI